MSAWPAAEQGVLAARSSLAGERGPVWRSLVGAWLEKDSVEGDGKEPAPPRTEEHAKVHIYVLPVVCWVPLEFGVGARRGAALGAVGWWGGLSPVSVGGHAGLEQMHHRARMAGRVPAPAGPCRIAGAEVLLCVALGAALPRQLPL